MLQFNALAIAGSNWRFRLCSICTGLVKALPGAYFQGMLTSEERRTLREELAARLKITLKPREIRALKVNSALHWQPPLYIETGQTCRYLDRDNTGPQEILAIFEATVFLVVTPGHGHPDGLPYYFSREDVRRVEEMD